MKKLITMIIALLLSANVWAQTSVSYYDGALSQSIMATPISVSSNSLSTGWYYVASNIICNHTITVIGNVRLILLDGYTLTINGGTAGINVSSGNSLAIYGETVNGTGLLNITGDSYHAGIGANDDGYGCGPIAIYGGIINATGGSNGGAGIGRSYNETCGGVTIYGGIVNTTGGDNAAGIGGGVGGSCGGDVTIYDGIVNAWGNNGSAGIGGGVYGSGGLVTIRGGMVNAICSTSAAEIGGGNYSGDDGECIIIGRNVIASSIGTSPTNVNDGGGAVFPLIITDKRPNSYIYVDIDELLSSYSAYTYQALTDADGKATIWLPTGYSKSDVYPYAVICDANGGSTVETQHVNAGDLALSPSTPIKEGYIFNGWYTSDDILWNFSLMNITQDTTLYANWLCDGIGDYLWKTTNADTIGGYPYYHSMYPDSAANHAKYGLLFDFAAAQSACPAG